MNMIRGGFGVLAVSSAKTTKQGSFCNAPRPSLGERRVKTDMTTFICTLVLITLCGPSTLFAQHLSANLIAAARARTQLPERYDGSYQIIPYPHGDVPNDRGVCTDLVIRAYRALRIDLQVLVHEDMKRNFGRYPQMWGLQKPDPNIDHRRVPNLRTFFARQGAQLPVSQQPSAYQPGDLVTWRLPRNLPHIGIVSDQKVLGTERPKIIHNIGAGPVEDDILFAYPITGHYRFYPKRSSPASQSEVPIL